jgi:hypothetical protein
LHLAAPDAVETWVLVGVLAAALFDRTADAHRSGALWVKGRSRYEPALVDARSVPAHAVHLPGELGLPALEPLSDRLHESEARIGHRQFLSVPARNVRTMQDVDDDYQLHREILLIESQRWNRPAVKEDAIKERLGLAPVRYYQLLNQIVVDPSMDLAAEFPAVIRRLRTRLHVETGKRFGTNRQQRAS